jgi:MoxR-like ATPase
VKTLARVLRYDFKRVSFTPDLLPGDITGYEMYRKESGKFEVRKGPVFTHILLADEINRTPPKVQSALLEAMEERQITIGEKSLALPSPFFVIATENPLEHEGTYPLPEAELDRFLMKLIVTYPAKSDEKKIIIEKSRPKGDRDQTS